MKAKPQKGREYDNFDGLLKARANRWQVLSMRDEFLSKLFVKTVEDNNLKQYLWQADTMDPNNGTTDTAVVARWKLWYPYVVGDRQYNADDEKRSETIFCSITVIVHGTQINDFRGNVYFAFSGKDGALSSEVQIAQAKLKEKIITPIWFEPTLLTIYTPNSQYFKR